MVKTKRINPIARAIAIMSAVVIVSGSATYAALAGQAQLTGNTISTISSNTPDLTVNNRQDNNFNQTEEGFHFANLTPGEWSETKRFQLKNSSDNPLDIYLQITGESALPTGVNGNDIVFQFRNEAGTLVEKTWQQLIFEPSDKVLDDLAANDTENMRVRVKVNTTASDNIDISSFTFTFTGKTES